MLAKIASDWLKPSGIKIILPAEASSFMKTLPLRKIPGIGPMSEEKLRRLGFKDCSDIQEKSQEEITEVLGKRFGSWLYKRAFGIDNRELETERKRKSIGHEDTFPYDLIEKEDINQALQSIIQTLVQSLEKKKCRGRTITLKVTYHDFKKITRSLTIEKSFRDFSTINNCTRKLLEKTEAGSRKIRLLGVSISSLEGDDEAKKSLFND